MTSKTLHILLALLDGPLHGYGIKHAVEQRTEGRVRIGPGTLYEAIQRLERDGLIHEVPAAADEPASGGPTRRFYDLTTVGRNAAADEVTRMADVVRFATDRKLVPRHPTRG
jgi:DNA-binding PadR family transcriptional regulator